MFFTRIIITAVLAFGTLTTAYPAKRDTSADLKDILGDLKSKTDIIVPQISKTSLITMKSGGKVWHCLTEQLASTGNANATTVRPLLDQLTHAFDVAILSLKTTPSNGPTSRETEQEVAELMKGIINVSDNATKEFNT